MFNLFKSAVKKYENISTEKFNSLKNQEGVQLIDVRSRAEVAAEAIPGNIAIDLFSTDFRGKVEQLDKSKQYLVYCRSGNRSGQACAIMTDAGFEHVYNLAGGIAAWKNKGLPTTSA